MSLEIARGRTVTFARRFDVCRVATGLDRRRWPSGDRLRIQNRCMAPSVGLDRSRIDRALGGLIEIAEAGPANRCFPDRVTERLGICLKTGPAHRLRSDGRVTSYPANAICVRPPGCIWSVTATGPVGFISIDLAAPLLPAGIPRGATMAFAPRDTEALPDIVRLASDLRTNPSDRTVRSVRSTWSSPS